MMTTSNPMRPTNFDLPSLCYAPPSSGVPNLGDKGLPDGAFQPRLILLFLPDTDVNSWRATRLQARCNAAVARVRLAGKTRGCICSGMTECSYALCHRDGRRAEVPIREIADLFPLCDDHVKTVRHAHEDEQSRVRWDLDPYGPGIVWIVDQPTPVWRR